MVLDRVNGILIVEHFYQKYYGFFPSVSYPVQFFFMKFLVTVKLICCVCHVWKLYRLLLPKGMIMKILEKEAYCVLENEILIYALINKHGFLAICYFDICLDQEIRNEQILCCTIDEFGNGI